MTANATQRGPDHASSERMGRRLAAILHADVQGYSHLIAHDEEATLRILTPYLQMMKELVHQHGGQVVGSRGDSLLAEFPSVRNAVQCAVEMQHELKARNTELPPEQCIAFRMGIHVGKVIEEDHAAVFSRGSTSRTRPFRLRVNASRTASEVTSPLYS